MTIYLKKNDNYNDDGDSYDDFVDEDNDNGLVIISFCSQNSHC